MTSLYELLNHPTNYDISVQTMNYDFTSHFNQSVMCLSENHRVLVFSSDAPPLTAGEEAGEEEDGAFSAGVVAVIAILFVAVVLMLLVVISRSLLRPSFERLDDVPLVADSLFTLMKPCGILLDMNIYLGVI
ncbi:hypothetical protein NHX12_032863 [Muraenolepis orangiensis]|uniref:Uncharacterized protein n=1 Tax=Muraenolepis orangiensis TaxID=630683 RepID=A0A9Q0II67_9TELE|nr:hypothetical protein NHX12_032863 [Muraenolepis orangiensis]